ncbi:MAG: glycosyltransferase family 39 protein, partial [Bacteroidales bacterium]|nr:glycosyltransferase family 39 protein [Bacteroidales bacterium]
MIKSILENFYTIFWIISVLFIFSSFFFYRKNYSKIFNSWILFIITFLYTIYWIPQGFDITDEGYMLSKSWFMTHGMWSYNIDKIWGSTLLNKLRLSVLGTPSLIWVRFGYSIVVALMAVFSFKILKFRFDKIEAFISVFALSLISYSGRLQIINYHNISTLILLISIYFFVLAFVKKNNKILIISGFLILLATVSKITLGLFLAYPFFYFLIINVLEKNKFSEFIIKN